MSEDSARAVDQLDRAEDQLRDVAGTLAWARRAVEVDELYRAGGALSSLTGALVEITRHLAEAAEHCGDDRILRDDEDTDPRTRVTEAIQQLRAAEVGYIEAGKAIGAYHAAIGHVGVAADLHATSEDEQ